MDVLERYLRSGLELAGFEVDDVDVAIIRVADGIYGPPLRALQEADLLDVWPEVPLDPACAPQGSPPGAVPAAATPAGARTDTSNGDSDEGVAASAPEAHPQDLPLREQAALVAAGELDPVELLQATLERIEERDGELRSVIATFPEEAERMLAEAPRGPLHGVPIGVKDQFRLPWRGPTDGTPREALPAGDSGVFRRLREAGAVVPAVTNMHWWGGGSTGHVSAYGAVGNPWNSEHCGGGSSGGSAAAVGARLIAGAVGADGGGSIRLPAAYCGITGIKPTYASIPVDGNVHGYLSMDAPGPLCRDAADSRLLLAVLSGRELPAADGSRLRAGIVRSPFWEDLDPEVESASREALRAAGWSVEELEIEGVEHSMIAAVLHVALEGGPAIEPEDLVDADPVMRALAKYQALLPAGAFLRAGRVRSQLRRSVASAFARVDVLVWPTVPAPAPRIDNPTVRLPSGPAPADAGNVRQAGFGNLTGLPGVSVPVGLHSSGLPIGLMIQGAWGDDSRVLDAAEHLERATGREFVDAAPPIAATA